MKVDIDLIEMTLRRNEIDAASVKSIIEDIKEQVALEKGDDKPPTQKKQTVILVSDPDGDLAKRSLIGWVVKIPEDDSPVVAPQAIRNAATDFNMSPKGRRLPVDTFGDAIEAVSSKFLKEHAVWVQTKEPVSLIAIDNNTLLVKHADLD